MCLLNNNLALKHVFLNMKRQTFKRLKCWCDTLSNTLRFWIDPYACVFHIAFFSTQCANDFGPYNCVCKYRCAAYICPGSASLSMHSHTGKCCFFNRLKQYFKICNLIFFNFYSWRIEPTYLTCKKNFSINILECEGHNPWHTR